MYADENKQAADKDELHAGEKVQTDESIGINGIAMYSDTSDEAQPSEEEVFTRNDMTIRELLLEGFTPVKLLQGLEQGKVKSTPNPDEANSLSVEDEADLWKQIAHHQSECLTHGYPFKNTGELLQWLLLPNEMRPAVDRHYLPLGKRGGSDAGQVRIDNYNAAKDLVRKRARIIIERTKKNTKYFHNVIARDILKTDEFEHLVKMKHMSEKMAIEAVKDLCREMDRGDLVRGG